MFGFREIAVDQLSAWLDGGAPQERPRPIEVRTPGEAGWGVLPEAERVPLASLPACCGADLLLPDGGARSAQACAFMAARGHARVCSLRGGIMAWRQRGRSVAQYAPGA